MGGGSCPEDLTSVGEYGPEGDDGIRPREAVKIFEEMRKHEQAEAGT